MLVQIQRATNVLASVLRYDVEVIRKRREEDAHRKIEAMFVLMRHGKMLVRNWRERNRNRKTAIVRQFLSAIAYNL